MHARETVALVLMKSEEADATVAVVQEHVPHVSVNDRGTYWYFEAEKEIPIDLNLVSQELGREISLSEWLVVMSSYVGRVETQPDLFRVTSEMSQLDPESSR